MLVIMPKRRGMHTCVHTHGYTNPLERRRGGKRGKGGEGRCVCVCAHVSLFFCACVRLYWIDVFWPSFSPLRLVHPPHLFSHVSACFFLRVASILSCLDSVLSLGWFGARVRSVYDNG